MAPRFLPSKDVTASAHVFGDQSSTFGCEYQFNRLQRAIPVDLHAIGQHSHADLLLSENAHQVKPHGASIHAIGTLEVLGQQVRNGTRIALFHGLNRCREGCSDLILGTALFAAHKATKCQSGKGNGPHGFYAKALADVRPQGNS